jgi:CBS domain-containing protein
MTKSVLPGGAFPFSIGAFAKGSDMYEFLQETVANNMTEAVKSVTPETTVRDLYRLFAADEFEAFPVVKDEVLVGMVSKLDALKVFAFAKDQLLPHYADGMDGTVNDIMTTEVTAVEPDTNLQRVLQLLVEHQVKSLPVVNQWRNLVGIIAREDVMQAMARCARQPTTTSSEATRCLPSA